MDDHQLAGLGHGLQNGVIVEGNKGAGVDDLAADALLLQNFSGLHGLVPHEHIGYDGHILALAADGGLAEGDGVILLGNLAHGAELAGLLALAAVEQLMLKHQHRVVVADGLLHQTLGVVGGGGADDLQTGAVDEIALERLGVLCAAVGGAAGGAHDHGDMYRTAGHIAHLGGLVHQLIHHAEQEVAVLQVGHGAHTVHGGAYAHAGDQDLGDGGVDAADLADVLPLHLKAVFLGDTDVRTELVADTLGDGERAAHTAGDVLILAQHENAGVSAHFFGNSAFISVSNRHHSHGLNPPRIRYAARTRSRAEAQSWHTPRPHPPRSPPRSPAA